MDVEVYDLIFLDFFTENVIIIMEVSNITMDCKLKFVILSVILNALLKFER